MDKVEELLRKINAIPPVVMRKYCPWCLALTPCMRMHGHVMCCRCMRNIEPCCDGGE